jgi:arylsulfatase A-like enzyme
MVTGKASGKLSNILLFTTDQHRWDGWGLMNGEVKTPNLDRIFGKGVRFSGAVCQAPMCIPSRYSYMSGLYPSQVGSRLNAQTWQDPAELPVKVLAEYLSAGGYETIGCGKTHYTMGANESRGIRAALPDNRGFRHRAWSGVRGSGEAGLDARFWPEEDPDAQEYFMGTERSGSAPFPAGGEGLEGYKGSSWPYGIERTREGWATRCAIDFLEEAEKSGKPWFLNLSYDLPHAPFCTVAEFEALYDGMEITVPEDPPPGVVEHWGTFENTANFLEHWQTLDHSGKRAIIVKYHALCSMVDHLFGQVVDYLEKSGELSNTWILFCSDHGESLGDRRRFSKYSLYESSVRVPLAVSGPGIGVELAGSEVSAPVELVDLVPTILNLAQLPVPAWLPGRDLLSGSYRTGSFAEMHGTGAEERQAAPVYMWRTEEWKLILSLPGTLRQAAEGEADWEGELYDLESDPGELQNLYQESRYRDLREDLTLALLRQLACANARYPYPDTLPRI